jgi:presenilin-like A22 family membrane protease
MLLLSASIVDISGYMLQVVTILQKRYFNRIYQLLIASLLLLLFLLLLFVSSLLVRTIVLKSWGMTYVSFKQRFSRNRDTDGEIVIYIP